MIAHKKYCPKIAHVVFKDAPPGERELLIIDVARLDVGPEKDLLYLYTGDAIDNRFSLPTAIFRWSDVSYAVVVDEIR